MTHLKEHRKEKKEKKKKKNTIDRRLKIYKVDMEKKGFKPRNNGSTVYCLQKIALRQYLV